MMSNQSTPSRLVYPGTTSINKIIRTPTTSNAVIPHTVLTPSSLKTTPNSSSHLQSTISIQRQEAQPQQRPSSSQNNNVKVVARFRPFNEAENISQSYNLVQFHDDTKSLSIKTRNFQGGFTFDKIFDETTSQVELYEYSIADTVIDLFEGFHGTILCYGQTGSGKTHSMMGDLNLKEMRGIIPRIGAQLFDTIANGDPNVEYTVGISYLEIYNETLNDLLIDPTEDADLKIIEDKINGIHVRNLSNVYISCKEEMFELMKKGNLQKVVSATNMNKESSRSHSIFQINLKQSFANGTTKFSKLYLVDLAGSEKIEKTGATGQTLEEAKRINSSLSALGNVINALTDGKSTHIPYRDSKLTRILQESLGGNSRTTLIINCSPSSLNDQETLSTLRFGARAKNIKNHALVNEELSTVQLNAKIDKLTKEREMDKAMIEDLQRELFALKNGAAVHRMSDSSDATSSDITVVGTDEDCTKDMSSVLDQLSLKDRELETLENFKDQQLISLKLKVAELETINESLIYDLKGYIDRNVTLQMANAEMAEISRVSTEKKVVLEMQRKIESLAFNLTNVQNKNNDLMGAVKHLEGLLEAKKKEVGKLEDSLKEQQQQTHRSLHLQSPSDEKFSRRTARGSKVGLNLNVMKPLRGGEKY